MPNGKRCRAYWLTLLCAAGCREQSGGPAVDDDAVLSELSDEEAVRVCQYGPSTFDDAIYTPREYCLELAVAQTATPETCLEFVSSCLEGPQAMHPQEATQKAWEACAAVGADSYRNCEATFGEYTECLTALVEQSLEQRASRSCDDVRRSSWPMAIDPSNPSYPDVCALFNERCPGVFQLS